jgi:hypothetical protein
MEEKNFNVGSTSICYEPPERRKQHENYEEKTISANMYLDTISWL